MTEVGGWMMSSPIAKAPDVIDELDSFDLFSRGLEVCDVGKG
jgi:hypothetical protein